MVTEQFVSDHQAGNCKLYLDTNCIKWP